MAYPPNSFVGVAETLIKDAEGRVKLGERSQTLVRDYRQRLKCYCEPFFKKMLVRHISHRTLKDFQSELAAKGLSVGSIRPIMSFVSSVLKTALNDGVVRSIPNVPKPSQRDAPRPSFTRAEYQTLLRTLQRLEAAKDKPAFKGHELDQELRDAVTLMVNSFLRPGDLFVMRNKHIDVVEEPGAAGRVFLRLRLPSSKGHASPIVSMRVAVPIYKRVFERQKKAGYGKPDDHVFLPAVENRSYAKEIFSRLFVQVLDRAGLRTTANGETRTFYSLRHYAIERRLVNADGLDVVTLAKNCRTSPEMIHRFYAHWLEPERNLDLIQSFRRESRYA